MLLILIFTCRWETVITEARDAFIGWLLTIWLTLCQSHMCTFNYCYEAMYM